MKKEKEEKLTQEEFVKLFSDTRFRYIHDVNRKTIQGTNVLDMTWNEKGYGIFYTVNGLPPGGDAKESNLLLLNCNYTDVDLDPKLSQDEMDKLLRENLVAALKTGVPAPTIIVRTKKGAHFIWLYLLPVKPTPENILKWREVQKRIVHTFKGDTAAVDPSRVLRLPDTLHLKDPTTPFLVKVMAYNPESRCTLEELDKAVPKYSENEVRSEKTPAIELLLKGVPVGEGLRNSSLMQIAGLLLRDADTPEKIAVARQNYYDWDQKVVGSPEPIADRRKELDSVFEGILKLHISKPNRNNLPVIEQTNYQELLDAIPKDTPKENILLALQPLLKTLAAEKSLGDGELYIRNKIRVALNINSKDIDAIVRDFKKLRNSVQMELMEAKKKAEQEIKTPPLTEEEKQVAVKILKSPTLLFDVLQMVKKLGVVGEEKNILLHYLIFTSRLLKKPLSSTVKGDSSSGKSYTLLTTMKLLPETAYIDLTDATPQSFFYCPEDHFKHRIIVLFEKHGGERADYAIRTLQSEGKLKIQVTVKNPETGQFEAQTIEKEGPTGFVTTTTASSIHAENDTRNISMFPDQSAEQTSRVYESVDSRYLGNESIGSEALIPWHHAQQSLETLSVQIPYVRSFRKYFPKHIVRTRRDYGHFLAIIEAIAFLHQKQREIIEMHGQKFIRATLADAYMAKVIVENALSKSIYELPEKSIEVIQTTRTMIEDIRNSGEIIKDENFTITGLSKIIKWDRDTVAKWMRPAIKKGYITEVEESKGRKGARYILEEKDLPGDSFLPSIKDLLVDNANEDVTNIYNPITGKIVDIELETEEVISTDAPTEIEEDKKMQDDRDEFGLEEPNFDF